MLDSCRDGLRRSIIRSGWCNKYRLSSTSWVTNVQAEIESQRIRNFTLRIPTGELRPFAGTTIIHVDRPCAFVKVLYGRGSYATPTYLKAIICPGKWPLELFSTLLSRPMISCSCLSALFCFTTVSYPTVLSPRCLVTILAVQAPLETLSLILYLGYFPSAWSCCLLWSPCKRSCSLLHTQAGT